MKNILTISITALIITVFSGCMSNTYNYNKLSRTSESFNISKIKKECLGKGEVKIFPDGSALCVKSKEQIELENKDKMEHYASYERNYLEEYNKILKNSHEIKTAYKQPVNKKEPCKIWFGYTKDNKWFKEESYKIFWDGGCKNGFANGLGREIEKDTLLDRWGLAIYKNGKPTYYIKNDVLKNFFFEGIDDQSKEISYGVITQIDEKRGDINVVTTAITEYKNEQIALLSRTSPFWNGTYQFSKKYPNFEYVYLNYEKNDEAKINSEFFLSNGKDKNGWAIGKHRNNVAITGEYVMNKFNNTTLPSIYTSKADTIIKEIGDAQQNSYQAQEQAQLVKKQYMKRICKDKVKVNFMDNDDYKLICNNYKREKELYTKINDKLEKLTKKKIARLEQQRYTEKQRQQEQYRQQQLAIERQKLAAQQAQAKAAQDAADSASWNNFNQSIQNLNNQLNNMNRTNNFNASDYDLSKQQEKKYYYVHPMGPNLYYVK